MNWRAIIIIVALALASCAVVSPSSDINALMAEGQQLYSAQRYDEAIARFQLATSTDPANYRAYVWLARSLAAKRDWPNAAVNARRAVELSRGAPDAMAALLDALLGGGNEALARGAFVDSIGYFKEYLEHQPGNIQAWINVGKAYWQSGAIRDAISAFGRVLQLDPNDPEAQRFLQGR